MAKRKRPKPRVYGAGSLCLVAIYATRTSSTTGTLARFNQEKNGRRGIARAGEFGRQVTQGKRSKGTLHTYQSEARQHPIRFFGDFSPPQVVTRIIMSFRHQREKEINVQGSCQDKKTRKTVLPKGPVKSLKDSTSIVRSPCYGGLCVNWRGRIHRRYQSYPTSRWKLRVPHAPASLKRNSFGKNCSRSFRSIFRWSRLAHSFGVVGRGSERRSIVTR